MDFDGELRARLFRERVSVFQTLLLKFLGQFICGNKKCDSQKDLKSYEVNFAYVEDKQQKNALVKLRLCSSCGPKLNYKKHKKQGKKEKGEKRKRHEEEMLETSKKPKTHDEGDITKNSQSTTTENESSIWSRQEKTHEQTKEEEFDEYFTGLFL